MHLDQLTIHRFRGLSGLALPNLGRINLIVGLNDTGKTSVLEALALYSDPLNPLHWVTTAERRNLEKDRGPVEALKWLFPQSPDATQKLQQIHVGSEGKYAIRECQATYTPLEATGSSEPAATAKGALSPLGAFSSILAAVALGIKPEKMDNWAQLSTALLNSRVHNIRRGAQLDLRVTASGQAPQKQKVEVWDDQPLVSPEAPPAALPMQLVLPFSHRLERLPVEQLSQATIAGFDQRVLSVMQMVDPLIESVEVLDPSGAKSGVWLRHRQAGVVPLSAFGDGVRRSLFYALALSQARGGLLLIDELETGIHVSAIGTVFSWLVQACQEFDVQLFATTHSLEAVDAVLQACRPAHLDALVAYQLRGVAPTRVERFGGEELETLRFEMGLDVRGTPPRAKAR